jgi:YD repeat-containing protein
MRSVNGLVRSRVSNGSRRHLVKVFSNIFSSKGRIVALLLITALLAPLFLLQPDRIAFAQGNRRSPISQPSINTAAPPQPFIIGAGTSSLSAYFSGLLLSASLTVSDYFSSSQLPPEFSAAKVPSVSEKLFASISPVMGFFVPKSSAAPPEPSQPSANVDFDFDNDGKTDFSRWQPSSQEWRIKNSNGGSVSNLTIGSSTSVIVPGDYDGDDITDRAVFSAGSWTIKKSSNGGILSVGWGTTGDKPVPADYDGDDITDLAIYRPSTGVWWIYQSGAATYVTVTLGTTGDILVPADYDGDGIADPAVFRPSNGNWYVNGSLAGSSTFTWGTSGDVPVAADYDADGKTDYAIYRPSTGAWWIYKSGTGTYIAPIWGNYGDQPVPGDYDGDNKADLAIWRPTNGVWYIVKSSNGSYLYEPMGQSGDIPTPSAYTKQIGAQPITNDLAKARLAPRNATGGTNLYSQNFSWGTQLVGLPGRAGLDMGLGISYNSLVWTKQGSNIFFDTDYSNVSPGFRLEFPTIEQVYQESGGDFYYVMVSPSGARTEFKQTAVTNYYETADSSYLQLKVTGATHPTDPVENLILTVYGTDGTQMSYEWKGGAYRCKEIKDSNGNYISIYHNDGGVLYTITDTLGREISINYDVDLYPTSITQTWKDTNGSGSNLTHTYATFSYTTKTVSTSFDSGLTVYGPPNSSVVKVLDRITYANGFSTKFDYNGYLQVWMIRNYAADSSSHVLNYVKNDLESPSSGQTDCPRFNDTANWAENFNVVSGTAQEVVTSSQRFSPASHTTGGQTFTGQHVQVWTVGHPDNLRTSVYFGSSGWNEGLTIATEDCFTTSSTCTTQKRWTWTDWTQDNTGLSYILNPRMTETKVGDGTNTKRTTFGYYSTGSPATYPYGLVNEVKQYDSDQSTVLKKVTTTYNLSSTYTDKRIIGLPSEVDLYEGASTLMSKVTYGYDDEDSFTFDSSGYGQSMTATRHDDTNYSTSFEAGRGNLTSLTRWNVGNSSDTVTAEFRHDIAGSTVAKIDPLGRRTKISYTDSFNTTVSNATYAYPTKITEMANTEDTGNNFSTVKYRYDFGAAIEATSPKPDDQHHGKLTKIEFDDIGRVEKQALWKDGSEYAYTRNDVTIDNGIQAKTYSTLIDADGDGDLVKDEILTESWFNGAGQMRQTRTELPGSAGEWSAVKVEYDLLGQTTRTSVPTEVSVSGSTFTPAGLDSTRGWIWNSQEYDWKGRVTRSIPSDSNGSDNKDTLISYEGCGCAGSQVTTVQGPVTTAVDVSGATQTTKRRTQKMYQDVLGRNVKAEIWDLDGGGSTPYSTSVNTFNARDQITSMVVTDNTSTASPQAHLDTTMTYDGHGRLHTKHIPEQDTSTVTTYAYNEDDTVATVTDARGAVSHYDYNGRGLLEEVSWTVPTSSPIPVPDDVEYEYDALGHRTAMSDGSGSTAYVYDSLSRLTSEEKTFTGLSGSFTLAYEYTIGGQLKKITDPGGVPIDYAYDKIGRISSVTGSGTTYAGVTDYALNFVYRAWGATKSFDFGNSTSTTLDYNDRLQITSYAVSGLAKQVGTTYTSEAEGGEYTYYPDGKLKFATDTRQEDNGMSPHDRAFSYDHMGRVKKAYSSLHANQFNSGTTLTPSGAQPFEHSFTYDGFSDVVDDPSNYWSTTDNGGGSFDSHNRNTAWSYDADGRFTSGNEATPVDYPGTWAPAAVSYDAAGRSVGSTQTTSYENTSPSPIPPVFTTVRDHVSLLDGDGNRVRLAETDTINSGTPGTNYIYYLYSSVTGNLVAQYDSYGGSQYNVYLGSNLLAQAFSNGSTMSVQWLHSNPVTGDGLMADSSGYEATVSRLDSTAGIDLGDTDPLSGPTPGPGEVPGFDPSQPMMNSRVAQYFPGSSGTECYAEGFLVGCHTASTLEFILSTYDDKVKKAKKKNIPRPGEHPGSAPGHDENDGHAPVVSFGGDSGNPPICPTDTYPIKIDGNWQCIGTENIVDVYADDDNITLDEIREVPLPTNFKDLLQQRIDSTAPGRTMSCNDFIAKLIAKATEDYNRSVREAHIKGQPGSAPYPGDVLPAAADGKGLLKKISNFVLQFPLPDLGTVRGSINGGDATVVIRTIHYFYPTYRNYNPIPEDIKSYVDTGVHEIVHLGSSALTDGWLAKAAVDLGETKEEINPYDADVTHNSRTYHNVLMKYCGGGK